MDLESNQLGLTSKENAIISYSASSGQQSPDGPETGKIPGDFLHPLKSSSKEPGRAVGGVCLCL